MIQWVWTWGGKSFGYRHGELLYTYLGVQAGRLYGDSVFARDGRYLGELIGDRLIGNPKVHTLVRPPFKPRVSACHPNRADVLPQAISAGYADFPGPEQFRLPNPLDRR